MNLTRRKRFVPQIEALERRDVMAITAVLANGTLTVTGSDAAESFIFRQINNLLKIDGVSGSFATSQIQRIIVDARGGNDLIQLNSQATAGQQAIAIATTVNGGAGNDTIQGSEAKDAIFGEDGNDVMWGNGADDYLDGGAGIDILYGMAGNDDLAGDLGGDLLSGGEGNDRLSGGDDADMLYGGNGNDSLDGGRGNDTLQGEAGNDALFDDSTGNTFADTVGTNTRSYTHYAWLDMTLLDARLRSLTRSLYVDQSLSRADMLALFAQTGADGSVSANELADLRALVGNGLGLGMTDAVRVLSGKVVNADTANLYYQTTTLGNLTANGTAAQLAKLVNKWFLGLDRPVTTDANGRTYGYTYAAGSLFVGGVAYTDVYQGIVGDCYFLAALAEAALRQATTITNMFTDNGDGTFTVRFYKNGAADYVTVDRYLPTAANGMLVFANLGKMANNAANELWVALAEKAYVQINASGWTRNSAMGGGQNKYNSISGGWTYVAIAHVTGKATTWSNLTNETALVNAVTGGKMVALGSKSSPSVSGVVGGHAYAIVGYNAQTKQFTVFNPWGINNGSAPGTLNLTWSQLQTAFAMWDSTV